jgi:hypothetical protein
MPAKINDGLTNHQRWAIRNPHKVAQKKYRQKNRKQLLMKSAEYREQNKEKIRQYYKANREKFRARAKARYDKIKNTQAFLDSRKVAAAAYAAELKREAISVYSSGSMMCLRCGCDDIDVLCLDHINDNGHKHRKTMRTTTYAWVKKNGYPLIFQVLCMNCNWKKHISRTRC